jgi:hypothetical protein
MNKQLVSIIIAVIFLTGCSKPPQTFTPQHWEYKVVTVENIEHSMKEDAYTVMQTNSDLGLKQVRTADADYGDFYLDLGDATGKYSVNIQALGKDGWELVSAVPQIEAVPNAEADGDEYDAETKTFSTIKFTNIRTGKIILIFKRPA